MNNLQINTVLAAVLKAKSVQAAAKLKEAEPAATTVTVLRAVRASARKAYRLSPDGQLCVEPYGTATSFKWQRNAVADIHALAKLIADLSKEANAILIRGAPVGIQTNPTFRRKKNFLEPEKGCCWVMLDFDAIPVTEGVSPIEPAAIELLIQKLPAQFQGASYFYQFSSSAGILKADGQPLKQGVSAHVFFWLSRPVHGKDMNAWLCLHCIEAGHLSKTRNRRDHPVVQYAYDPAVLRDVQPHYVAVPDIGPGVQCVMAPEHRQGLVEKGSHAVPVPDFEPGLRGKAASEHAKLRDAWKRECGYVDRTSLSKVRNGGVSVDRYLGPAQGAQPSTGRAFLRAEIQAAPARVGAGQPAETVQFARLYFEGEGSPGSWWVASTRPTLARRFGDDESMQLKVLSEGAYAHVRDELKWFEEVVHRDLSLTAEGFLPAFSTFIQARNTLIVAPTGSGKTSAFCQYALAHCRTDRTDRTDIIIYAAQTIALTNQMLQDLQRLKVPAFHYQSFPGGFTNMPTGVYVTTNASMRKFVEHLQNQGANFTLVIDEAHLGIDDFMRSDERSKQLDAALSRAHKTILMTGTITDLQIRKIAECVTHATGPLTSRNFEFCEFRPVRAHRLFWADEKNIGADLVALMRSHQALKAAGQPIPRTVVIVPTSSMRVYEQLLDHFGLTDDAMIVSRTETLQEDIEAARISTKSWLVSSPLFAIGLNFENPPVQFWTSFGRLQVDTSQVVQTVNRANRGQVACEVRLYAGRLDPTPFPYLEPASERATIEDYLHGEAEVQGEIDPRHQLDRLTYLELRDKTEKHTARALHRLKQDDAIQNYTIVEDWVEDLAKDPGDAALFNSMRTSARASYIQDVASRHVFHGDESIPLLLHHLEATQGQARHAAHHGQVPKKIEDDRRALLARITGNPTHVNSSGGPDLRTVSRLFAVRLPFLSGQYHKDKTEAWRPAMAEKVRAIIAVLSAIEELRRGTYDGTAFGLKMRQKGLRAGVLALAIGEADYLKLSQKLTELDKTFEVRNRASVQARAKLDKVFFKAANEFLARLGVEFKTTVSDGTRRLDPTQAVVPNWSFAKMRLELEILAQSVEFRPELEPDALVGAESFKWVSVSRALCSTCVHCSSSFLCAFGYPIEYFEDGVDPVQDHCKEGDKEDYKKGYKKISTSVLRMKEQLNRQEI
jgi:hypothetical protein